MLLIVSGAVPEFVSVTVFAALVVPTCCEPNARLVGEIGRASGGARPVPDGLAVCGLPDASSLICTLALRAPLAAGVNVTEIAQLALAASVAGLAGQSLVCA